MFNSNKSLILSFCIIVLALFSACVQPADDLRAVKKATVQPTVTVIPVQTQPARNDAPAVAEGTCPAGSEPAVAELRSCCKQRNWGQACDGGCWQAGVGEKLRKACTSSPAAGNDCASSPAKSAKSEWCSFHFNRRYCGISDADWLAHCKDVR